MDLQAQLKILEKEYKINPCPAFYERKKFLKLLKSALQDQAYTLSAAVNKDFGHRSTDESLFLEIFPTIKAIDYCLKNIRSWMKGRNRKVSWMFMPARAYLVPQPLGVVGIMVPWNYPIYLSLVPALYALAAGNRVMIKMSELTPHTGKALQELIRSLDIGDFVSIVNGDVEVAKQFSSLPFGHLLFTGSTAVGKAVMKAASENLTPVTLELGGKSPAILSVSMKTAYFKRLFMGKLFNAGQTCIAPDYLLVPKGWYEKIEKEFAAFMQSHYPNLMNNDNYSSIISEDHKERLLALVTDAQDKGAQIITYGELSAETNKMPVYLILGVTLDMKLMQQEIFGPIIPVMQYQFLNEAVEFINSLPNPLALYYFGEDGAEKKFLKAKTLSGALTINDTLMHVAIDDLPFGGVGNSGMGYYHGQEGFDTFSKLKPVLVQRRFATATWFYPPYGKALRLLLSWVGGIKMKKDN